MKGKILVLYERGAGMGRGFVISDEAMLVKKGEMVITNPIFELDESRTEDIFSVNDKRSCS